jgi:transcriptional regulator with XRE-family HTH domain
MAKRRSTSRLPLNDAYARLGAELRRIREATGKTTYQVPKRNGEFYKSGHVSNVEGGFTAPSEEFIRAYVGFGGRYDDLMTLLERAKRLSQPGPQASDAFDEQFLDPRTDPYTLRRGYAVDMQEDLSYLNDNGVPTKNLYKVSIRPLVATAKYFLFRYGHEGDRRRGVAGVQAGTGCTVALLDEDEDGTIFVLLEFDQTKADELGRCHFFWAILVDSTVPSKPFYDTHTKSHMGHIVKQIQFEPPALPEKIWWYRGADPFGNRLKPSPDQLLELNPINFYFHEFFNVESEACGLSWRWSIS